MLEMEDQAQKPDKAKGSRIRGLPAAFIVGSLPVAGADRLSVLGRLLLRYLGQVTVRRLL